MSENDVLSKAEVGALLTGVADGVVDTNGGVTASGEVSAFEFKSSCNVSSFCPASLVNVYTRAARQLQSGLYALLRQDVQVEIDGIRRHRYDEYFATMQKPICIHTVTVESLPGTALIVMDAGLVYDFVDNYFGGVGEPSDVGAERDITPSEVAMSRKLLDLILDRLTVAWSDIDALIFSAESFETDPVMVTVAAPTELMLVVKLKINLAEKANDCHIVMPLSMLAPVLAKLEASGQGSLRKRERFHQTMRQSLQKVDVTVRGNLVEVPLTLREMLSLLPGDVIPVDLPSTIGLSVEDVPVLYGRFGKSRGMDAVCVAGRAAENDQETP